MLKNEKREVVAILQEELKTKPIVLLLEHKQLSFNAFDKARRNTKEGTKIIKFKNNLAKIAFDGTNYSALNEHIQDQRLFILSDDLFKACQSAKFLLDYAKDHVKDSIKVCLGASKTDTYEPSTILALSAISSKEELQSNLLRAIKVVSENMLRVIKAKAETQGN